ncbi:MAG: secretin N-terminal domain-containing protein [Verrucomicrobiia bacterium]|jgi:general secretion pathway protein D
MKSVKKTECKNLYRLKTLNQLNKMNITKLLLRFVLAVSIIYTNGFVAYSQPSEPPPVPQLPARVPRTAINTNAANTNLTNAAVKKTVSQPATNILKTSTQTNVSQRSTNLPVTLPALPAIPGPTAAKPSTNPVSGAASVTANAAASNTNVAAAATATNIVPTRTTAPTLPAGAPTLPGVPAAPGTTAIPPVPAVPSIPAVPTPGLPAMPTTVGQTATNPAAAAAMITNAPTGKFAQDEQIIKQGMIRFQAADLSQVLDFYAELVNRTLLRPASLPDTKITIKTQTDLTRDEAIRAIGAVLAMNGITLIDVGDKFVKVVPENIVFQQAKPFSTSDIITNMPDMAPYVTVVRQLTNAKPSEVVQALQPFAKIQNAITPIDSSQILIIRDYADNVKRMLELLDKIDVSVPLEIEPVVIPIKYALASDIAQVLSSLTAGGGGGTTVGGATSGGRRGLTTSTSRVGFGTTGVGTTPGMPGYQPPGTTTQPGTTPGAAQSSFADRLRSIVQKASAVGEFQIIGQAKIIADERTNSLLIFADKRDMEMITNIIAKLDVVLAQVLIESLIMEVQLKNDNEYGLSYQQRKPTRVGGFTGIGSIINGTVLNPGSFTTVGTNAASALSGFSYFGRFSQDLDVTATAIARDSRFNVLSKPRILTSHAKEARIFVGETRPYITGTYGGYYGGYAPYSQYQQLPIGIELSVLPFINADGLVVMDIKQTIKNIGGEVKIDNNSVPITIDREAQAYVAVRDRDTVILGGFITSDITKSSSGVPVLKDIPLLGALFKNSSSKKNRNELIVLIRPTVLPTPELAAKATEDERNLLPGVKRAEQEEEELRRMESEKLERENKMKLLKKTKK